MASVLEAILPQDLMDDLVQETSSLCSYLLHFWGSFKPCQEERTYRDQTSIGEQRPRWEALTWLEANLRALLDVHLLAYHAPESSLALTKHLFNLFQLVESLSQFKASFQTHLLLVDF